MSWTRSIALPVAAVCAACGGVTVSNPTTTNPPTFVDAVISSTTVFLGTVVATGARTTAAVPASPLTTVVQIDSLIASDSAIVLAAGDSVTVVSADNAGVVVGAKFGYLSYGLAADTGLVVREAWRAPASTPSQRQAFVTQYLNSLPLAEDALIREHLPQVDFVASATVTGIDSAVVSDSVARRNRSESAAMWRVATIKPMHVYRGDTTLVNKPVRVLFPASQHITYSLIPRPQPGDSAVYLVHRTNRFRWALFIGVDTVANTFVLFHDLDVRALGDTTRIAPLVLSTPPVP